VTHPTPINIGDTVTVRGNSPRPWLGEVLAPGSDPSRPDLLDVRVVDPHGSGERVGEVFAVAPARMTRWGDPNGMRDSDGCDDVDVTGRVRPYHRHAVTGKAHAHPGGQLAHTHFDQPGFEDAAVGPRSDVRSDLVEVFDQMIRDVADSRRLGPEQRERHTAAMEAMPAADLAGTDSPEVFALLRDVADAEPLVVILGAARCTMCGARDPEPNGDGHPPHPHPHLLSCPWARVTHLVGVKADG
jgi:hypothetical protein